MEKISQNKFLHTADPKMWEERGSIDKTDPKVLWECGECGIIEPWQCKQGWVRSYCDCEHKERRIKREEEIKEREKQVFMMRYCTPQAFYGWLGSDYRAWGVEDMVFANFKPTNPRHKMALDQMKSFISLEEMPKTIIISGPVGVGKTHLASALLNYYRLKGTAGLFTSGANLFNALLSMDSMSSKQSVLTRLYKTPILVLDDPDHMTATEYRQGTYKEIFTSRCAQGHPTIITTNVIVKNNVMEMAHVFGEAAASRLNVGMTLIAMPGDDYRLKQNWKSK